MSTGCPAAAVVAAAAVVVLSLLAIFSSFATELPVVDDRGFVVGKSAAGLPDVSTSQPPTVPQTSTRASAESRCAAFGQLLTKTRRQKTLAQYCPVGPSTHDAGGSPSLRRSPRRVAIVVRGESFRGGLGMGDRSFSTSEASVRAQREAAQSLLKMVVQPFEKCGLQVDLFLASYIPTSGTERNIAFDLVKWYGGKGRVKKYKFFGEDFKGQFRQVGLFKKALGLVAEYAEQQALTYQALLVVRPDMIFKTHLPSVISNATWSSVLFGFRLHERFAGSPDKESEGSRRRPDYVADQIEWCPWEYTNCLVACGPQYRCLMKKTGGHVSVMLDERHDSDSQADSNPLYRLVRQESRLEVHGGVAALLLFGESATMPPMLQQLQAVRAAVLRQGEPPTKWVDVYAHAGNISRESCRELRDALVEPSLFYGLSPHLVCGRFDVTSDRSYQDVSPVCDCTLRAWAEAVRTLSELLRDRETSVDFEYDGVVIVGVDGRFQGNYQVGDYDTKDRVHVEFGPLQVPHLLIASSRGLAQLVGALLGGFSDGTAMCEKAREHPVAAFERLVRGVGLSVELVKTPRALSLR